MIRVFQWRPEVGIKVPGLIAPTEDQAQFALCEQWREAKIDRGILANHDLNVFLSAV